jgi:hypothetical protein
MPIKSGLSGPCVLPDDLAPVHGVRTLTQECRVRLLKPTSTRSPGQTARTTQASSSQDRPALGHEGSASAGRRRERNAGRDR